MNSPQTSQQHARFRATLEARERHRQILVDALESHCASERRKHALYRVFLVFAIFGVGYLWLDRLSVKIVKPVQNIVTAFQNGNVWKKVRVEMAGNSHQMIGTPVVKVAERDSRYDRNRDPRSMPTEVAMNARASGAVINKNYVQASVQQLSFLKPVARSLASRAGYREAGAAQAARLPEVRRTAPISKSQYIWVNHAVPLRLVADSEQFPDLNN